MEHSDSPLSRILKSAIVTLQKILHKHMRYLSIDFGTVLTKAAIFETGNNDGGPQLVRMDVVDNSILYERAEEPLYDMPTAVFYDEKNDTYKVGIEAIRSRVTDPDNYHDLFKGRLSRDIDSSQECIPWVVEILKYVILRAINNLESSEATSPYLFDKIILTVPSSTIKDDNRWKFMITSIEVAIDELKDDRNISVLPSKEKSTDRIVILKEPEAAGYFILKDALKGYNNGDIFLVYDFGGGTFDPALLEYRNGTLRSIGEWDSEIPRGKNLGGIYIDELIKEDIINHKDCEIFAETIDYFSQFAIVSSTGQLLRPENISRKEWKDRKNELQKIEKLATEAKHKLSNREIDKFIKKEDDDYSYVLTREDYYEMIEPTIDDTIHCCCTLISEYGYSWKDIKQVFLVGGSSSIPLVKDKLEEKREREEASFCIVPEQNEKYDYLHAVALGASLFETLKPSAQQREEFGWDALKHGEWSEAEYQFIESKSYYGMGIMEYEGLGRKKLYKNAYKIFSENPNDPRCSFMQSLMLFKGEGVKKNDDEALQIIEKMMDDVNHCDLGSDIRANLIKKGTILNIILDGDGQSDDYENIYSEDFYKIT